MRAIDVDCRSDGGMLESAVRYGLAASLRLACRLLMDSLMDGSARSVIHRHRPAQRIREGSLQGHSLTQTGTA